MKWMVNAILFGGVLRKAAIIGVSIIVPYYGYLFWTVQSQTLINKAIKFRNGDANNSGKQLQIIISQLDAFSKLQQSTDNKGIFSKAMWNAGKQDDARLEYVLLKHLHAPSRRLNFVAAGGSITFGRNLTPGSDFPLVLSHLLNSSNVSVKMSSIAMGGTTSRHYAMCITEHVDLADVDVLFVEFVINDEVAPGSIEELVRSVWRVNPFVHIIYISMIIPKWVLLGQGRPKDHPLANWTYVEKVDSEVVQHYKLPAIQWKHLLGDANNLTMDRTEALARQYSGPDYFHPGAIVHRFVADSIFRYLQRTAKRLAENLRIETGRIEDKLKRYENEIKSSWMDLEKTPRFPITNWLDGVACFININQSQLKSSDGLKSAIVAQSQDKETGPTNVDMWSKPNDPRSFDSRLRPIVLPRQGSWMEFYFETSDSTQPNCSFIPRLAFEHALCSSCRSGEILVHAIFKFANGRSSVSQTYHVPLTSHGYIIRLVVFAGPVTNRTSFLAASETSAITPQERAAFCDISNHSAIESVHLRLEQTSKGDVYPFLLQAIMLAYDCCS